MFYRLIPLIIIVCVGCRTSSKTAQMNALREDNRDVVALSYLISNYMDQTDDTKFSLLDIVEYDTLRRVVNNFSSVAVGGYWPNVWRGGYTVYFKFSDNRNNNSVHLSASERIPWKVKTKDNVGRNDEQISQKYDGEIRFYDKKRFYEVAEIILSKHKN